MLSTAILGLLLLNMSLAQEDFLEDEVQAKILHGAHGYIPYQVFLRLFSPTEEATICGGSLISYQHVLTAGHCLQNVIRAFVGLGVFHRSEPYIAYTVGPDSFYVHSAYRGDNEVLTNDIAVIFLPPGHNLMGIPPSTIQPVRLPKSSWNYVTRFAHRSGLISGFGKTEDAPLSETLLHAVVPITSASECSKHAMQFNTDHPICTMSDESGVDKGDSGGPLVVYEEDELPTLVGITSYLLFDSKGFNQRTLINIYTDIEAYLPWIEAVTGIPIRL